MKSPFSLINMLSRRNFLFNCIASACALTPSLVFASRANTNGYIELDQSAPDGIYNFFSYACGHCYRFHPHVEALRADLAKKGRLFAVVSG